MELLSFIVGLVVYMFLCGIVLGFLRKWDIGVTHYRVLSDDHVIQYFLMVTWPISMPTFLIFKMTKKVSDIVLKKLGGPIVKKVEDKESEW